MKKYLILLIILFIASIALGDIFYSHLKPDEDNHLDIGTTVLRWKKLEVVDINAAGDVTMSGDCTVTGEFTSTGQIQADSSITFVGEDAGKKDRDAAVTSIGNLFLGYQAGYYNDSSGAEGEGDYNVYIGYQAGYGTGDTLTAQKNLCIGYQAGLDITSGGNNVLLGYQAGENITTGGSNFALGVGALETLIDGSGNVAIGTIVLNKIDTESGNTAIGFRAMRVSTGSSSCTSIGYKALESVINADQITAIGYQAGQNCDADYNTFIGYQAGQDVTSGSSNVCIGYNAGETNLTTGSNELWINNATSATPLIHGYFNAHASGPAVTINGDLTVLGTGAIGGATNKTSFAADGLQTMAGTARVTKGVWVPFNAIRAPGTKPATFKEWGISGVWEFSDATDDTVVLNFAIPYWMDRSVAPTLNIGWSTNTDVDTETAVWQLEYLYTAAGEDTTAAAQETLTTLSNAVGQADGLVVATITGIDVPSATDVCLHMRVKRLGADPNDDLTDTAELHGMCLVPTMNKLGTGL